MNLLDKLIASTLPIVPKPLVARVSARYIAGETLTDAIETIRSLNAESIRATLDVLGEFVEDLDAADRMVELYLEALARVDAESLDSNVSVKLTSLGLLIDEARCLENMRRLLRHATDLGNSVRIDMESSSVTGATLNIYRTLRREFDNVGCVIQAYLRRTMDDAAELARLGANVRVCKGIYSESRLVAYNDRRIIQRNFVDIVRTLLEAGCYVAIATHDEVVVWECERIIRTLGLSPKRYEFQMLLGVDEQLRSLIVQAGHPMRVYIPFGEHWYAYSLRRLRENPAIAGHVLRATLGLGPEENGKKR